MIDLSRRRGLCRLSAIAHLHHVCYCCRVWIWITRACASANIWRLPCSASTIRLACASSSHGLRFWGARSVLQSYIVDYDFKDFPRLMCPIPELVCLLLCCIAAPAPFAFGAPAPAPAGTRDVTRIAHLFVLCRLLSRTKGHLSGFFTIPWALCMFPS